MSQVRTIGRTKRATCALAAVAATAGTLVALAGCAAAKGGAVTVRDGTPTGTPSTPASAPASNPQSTPAAAPQRQASRGAPVRADKRPRLDPQATARLRERAVDLLARSATSGAPEVRANAVEAMLVAPRRLAPLMPRLLSDQNAAVRAVAAMAAGKARLSQFNPQLRVLVLADDPSPLARDLIRSSAIFGLARNGVDVNPGILADMLQSGDPRLRAHVAFLLGELGNPSASSLIRAASREPAPLAPPGTVKVMQLQMSEALFKLGDPSAIDAVRAALYPASIEDLEATVLAAQIIGQVKAQAGLPDLNNLLARALDPQRGAMPAEVRIAAAGGMVRLGQVRAAEQVEEYLTSPVAGQRSQSALVLGETREAGWLATLAPLLDDPDAQVAVAAAGAVLRITEGSGG